MSKVNFAYRVCALLIGAILCGLSLSGCEVQTEVDKQPPINVTKKNARSTYPGTGLVPAGANKFLGNILTGNAGEGTADYNLFKNYWNQVTPENAGKHGRVEVTRDVYSWAAMDKVYDFATQENLLYKHHTFVFSYGSNLPSWLQPLSNADIRAEMEEWIEDYFQRYPETEQVDVVNEALQNTPPTWFREALGNGNSDNVQWIRWMFQKARQYAPPGCELLINEAGVLRSQSRTDALKNLCNTLKLDGNIDGIGMQEHDLEATSAANVSTRLDQMATTGLDLYITEYDINKSSDTDQSNIMAAQFPVFWEHPQVKGVTFWGYREGKTWKPNTHLIRTDGTERPALVWLRTYLQGSGGAADDIVSITAPGSVARGSNATVSVNYKASTNRLIQVLLQQDTSPFAIYGSVNTNVSAGARTLNVSLPIATTVPVGTGAAKIVVILAPTGGGYPNRLDLETKPDVNVTAAAPTIDNLTSVSGPVTISRGSTVAVNVGYNASTSRRITLQLQKDTSPFTTYKTVTKDVAAGSGTTTINLAVPSTVPVGSAAYKYFVVISPLGGGYNNRFDDAQQADVTVQ
jgi:endo-1,4-beta-xylanase